MFDVDVAKQVGIIAAILFQNIAYWCQHSKANEKNYYDGRYWTFNTNKAFCELFPYLSSKMIRTALQKLVDAGLVVTGNYNKQAYDRTIWYALSENGESIFLKGQMDLPLGANGFAASGEPIPNINSNKNTNINTEEYMVRFDRFWAVYPNRVKKSVAQASWLKLAPDDALTDTIVADVERRVKYEWVGDNAKYVPHPTTYLNQRRWEDEPPPKPKTLLEQLDYDYDPWEKK